MECSLFARRSGGRARYPDRGAKPAVVRILAAHPEQHVVLEQAARADRPQVRLGRTACDGRRLPGLAAVVREPALDLVAAVHLARHVDDARVLVVERYARGIPARRVGDRGPGRRDLVVLPAELGAAGVAVAVVVVAVDL